MAAVSIALPVASQRPRALSAGSGASIDVYRGLGSWVDIYDDPAWAAPRATVRGMKDRGVRTLYLETSNFNRPNAFVFPNKVKRFVDAAHDYGVRIVAWYLPGFDDVDRDYARSMAAIDLVTTAGNSFDSFALDIESPTVSNPSTRTTRLLDLSSRIRAAAGDSYPLGAIIPSPRGVQTNPTYWPGFPYAELASTYDVFLPMTYFTWRVNGLAGAHWYTTQNIQIIRDQTGDPTVPIHVIGGIANQASTDETAGFVHAVRERGVIGASYYTYPITTDAQWAVLDTVPANPVGSPALPVRLGYADGLGNISGADQSHPKEVFYRTGGKSGAQTLSFEPFDAQDGEVTVWVNWQQVGTVAATGDAAWGSAQAISVPDDLLKDAGTNYISFVAQGDAPDWSIWGVRSVALAPAS